MHNFLLKMWQTQVAVVILSRLHDEDTGYSLAYATLQALHLSSMRKCFMASVSLLLTSKILGLSMHLWNFSASIYR